MMSEFFLKLGATAWLLAVGVSLLALIAQWLSNFQFSGDDWRALWLFLGGGGLVAMIMGGVLAIWDA